MSNPPTALDFVKELYHIWITERPNVLAAALAYFGMFSFAPVIFIAFTVAGFFVDELVVAEMDLDMIEEVRRTWQFYRDRRPETYGDMVEQLP